MASTKRSRASSKPAQFKDAVTISFKGCIWKYSLHFGSFDPADKSLNLPCIWEWGDGWQVASVAGSHRSPDPIAALQYWVDSEIESARGKIETLREAAKPHQDKLDHFKKSRWSKEPEIKVVSSKELTSKNLTARHYIKSKKTKKGKSK